MKNIVKGYRIMTGLSQQDMADLFDVSRQTYWSKENGRSNFTDDEKIIFTNEVKKVSPTVTVENIFFSQKLGNDSK